MFRRLGILLAALALFTVAGGHWAVLQSIAWAQMLRDYSKDAPVATALSKTFSGKFPCSMCRKIEEGRQSEKRTAPEISVEKKSTDFLLAGRAALPARPMTPRSYPPARLHDPGLRTREPAVPVPLV